MSHRGTAEETITKSDPIYLNRLVNMLANYIIFNKRQTNPDSFFNRHTVRTLGSSHCLGSYSFMCPMLLGSKHKLVILSATRLSSSK
ncbi:hypothetical protein G4B88_011631, partial [Cannabis sativa]